MRLILEKDNNIESKKRTLDIYKEKEHKTISLLTNL